MRKYLVIFYFCIMTVAKSHVTSNFDGRIAGDRTISECINGYDPTMVKPDDVMYKTTTEYARELGYPAEEHVVVTDDGYILTLHRIPGKSGARPVFLQHGLFGSSYDWVIIGKKKALAFILADAGYDVWLGNARGNTFSRCHTKYDTSSYEFWDFSWHEIGFHDVPAMIRHVTKTTGKRVIYIAHSMGTTVFFVMNIERPDIASSMVKLMIALAPIAFVNHSTSPTHLIAPFTRQFEFYTRARGTAEVMSQNPMSKQLIKYMCSSTMLQKKLCAITSLYTSDFNPQQFNYDLVPEILYHLPAGSSGKVLIHYGQEYNTGRFQHYDYGVEKNWKLYNSNQPPEYNISQISVPIGLFWSDDDAFSNPIDVLRLYEQLPNPIFSYQVEYSNFHHSDYLFGNNAPKYVYKKLLSIIKNYK